MEIELGEMNKLDGRQQLLVLMMEECGELIQECSKCLRKQEIFNMENLKKEIGDVYTLIELMHEWDIVSWTEIEERVKEKRRKLSQWSELIESPRQVDDYDKHFMKNYGQGY